MPNRDRIISKDELLDKLWPGQVVGENAPTRCIRAARSAVGDDGVKQEIIATQHGRGYRFIALVTTDPQEGQQEENQKAKVEETEKEKTQLNDVGLRMADLQDPSSNSPVSSSQSLVPNTQPPAAIHSWPIRRFVLMGLLLLLGIIAVVQYLSLLTPNPQSLAPSPQPLPLPDKPSIIVLPFVNLSGDPTQEYFGDGITEGVTSNLSGIASLFVIARTSAFTYKGKAAKVQDISREMGVRYVLEGSVLKVDHQVRVTAQLVDGTTGYHLWSEQYEREMQDFFTLHDEIVKKIVTTLKLQLTLWEQGLQERKSTNTLEAYDYYLRGLEAMYRYDKEANTYARQMLEKAIALDPEYAEAYAVLGLIHFIEWNWQWTQDEQGLEQAFTLGQKAAAMDDLLAKAHHTLAVAYMFKKQHEQALAEVERALTLSPNDADLWRVLAEVLVFSGRPEEAIKAIQKALRLNPHAPAIYTYILGRDYLIAGRHKEGFATLQKALARDPNFLWAHVELAAVYTALSREDEARAEVAEVLRLNPNFSLERLKRMAPGKDSAGLERYLTLLRKAGLK